LIFLSSVLVSRASRSSGRSGNRGMAPSSTPPGHSTGPLHQWHQVSQGTWPAAQQVHRCMAGTREPRPQGQRHPGRLQPHLLV
jgi:hypothetical protein